MRVEFGRTRLVFLIGRNAIKVPRTTEGFIGFVLGLIHNLNEKRRYRSRPDLPLGRVRWVAPFGLLLVMERLIPIQDEDWPTEERMEMVEWLNSEFEDVKEIGIVADVHIGNFGYRLDGTILCLDYGDIRRWH